MLATEGSPAGTTALLNEEFGHDKVVWWQGVGGESWREKTLGKALKVIPITSENCLGNIFIYRHDKIVLFELVHKLVRVCLFESMLVILLFQKREDILSSHRQFTIDLRLNAYNLM